MTVGTYAFVQVINRGENMSEKSAKLAYVIEVFNAVLKFRETGLGANSIKHYLNVNIPKPTIESWIYGGVIR